MNFIVLGFVILLSIFQAFSTIITAIICDGGIVIGSDSLTSEGALVKSRLTNRISIFNHETILCCANDRQKEFKSLVQDLRQQCDLRELCESGCGGNGHEDHEDQEACGVSRVKCTAAASVCHLARRLIHNRYPALHLIVAGEKRRDRGTSSDNKDEVHMKMKMNQREVTNVPGGYDHYLWEVLPGGTVVSHEEALVAGSGAIHAFSLLQSLLLFSPLPLPLSTPSSPSLPPSTSSTSSSLSRSLSSSSPSSPLPSSTPRPSLMPMRHQPMRDVRGGVRVVQQVVRAAMSSDVHSGGNVHLCYFSHGKLHRPPLSSSPSSSSISFANDDAT